MPKIRLEEPIAVYELLELALEHPDACYDPERHLPKPELIKVYSEKLQAKADLLEDYFSICFSTSHTGAPETGEAANSEAAANGDGGGLQLVALPMILPAIKPFAQELPMFLLRLASEVDFEGTDETKSAL